ncbi:MAG: GTPase HflX [Desulfovibrio sp.]|jgi:GTP-binding protein HflX|nr:GTPase HflX [Desulfovibrio sp.]
MVLVGNFTGILIPELPRSREGAGRLRGLRFLHTHLSSELLSQEDLMDMLFLRLDAVVVLVADEHGEPQRMQRAHLMPPNPENRPYMLYPAEQWDRARVDFTAEALALEEELARAWSAESERDAGSLPAEYGSGPRRERIPPLPGAERGTARETRPFSDVRGRAGEGGRTAGKGPENRAVLVSVSSASVADQESALAELAELARSAGVHVADVMRRRVRQVNPRSILGKGSLAELEVLALRGNAGLIIFDGELSPSHLGNLAEITERRVLDRTQLILDIFAQRALSRAGKFQVELAQLQYMLPRLVGKSRALDRLAGGIGGRGPGESKLETDRRRLRDRVARIKTSLKELRRQRAFVRARRAKSGTPTASLVGYTNAGKSTLLNALTGSSATAENRLFATLDPTTRRLRFPKDKELILTDTVGFIRSLPRELLEAFRATLEELEEADMLLHVADASHPELEQQVQAVEDILEYLGLAQTPRILVLNKIDALDDDPAAAADRVTPDGNADRDCRVTAHCNIVSDYLAEAAGPVRRQLLEQAFPGAFFISARGGEGLAALAAALAGRIDALRAGDAPENSARRSGPQPPSAALRRPGGRGPDASSLPEGRACRP